MRINVVVQMMLSIFRLQMIWNVEAGLPIFMQPQARQNQEVETGNVEEDIDSTQHGDTNIAISAGPDRTVINVEALSHAHVSTQTPANTVARIPPGSHGYRLQEGRGRAPLMTSHQQSGTTATHTVEQRTQTNQTTETRSTQATSINEGLSVANWATGLAVTGIITVMSGFLGNQASKPTHNFLLMGSMYSMMGSFVLGIIIFILSTIFSQSSVLGVVIKIVGVITVISIAMVVGFGVAFCFDKA